MPASHNARPKGQQAARVRRRAVAILMLFVIVASVGGWWFSRDRLPPVIRLATAKPGGLYHRIGGMIAQRLSRLTGREVQLVPTAGSVENEALLRRGEADLAVVQGATPLADVVAVTPLYHDVIHVVVRDGSGIDSIEALAGRAVSLGPPDSGMRVTARLLLDHHGVSPEGLAETGRYFTDLSEDSALDAAVVTTGLLNPDLGRLLAGGGFRLLPVPGAVALALRHAELEVYTVPRGFYHEDPPVPARDVITVATVAVLAARDDAPDILVQRALAAVYEHGLRRAVPTLIPREAAAEWSELPRHRAAPGYFEPYGGIGLLANFMESLAALKELLFALGAALYLAWTRWRRLEEKERAAAVCVQKERLDDFLRETIRVEREQMLTDEPERLRLYLDEVTRIKLQALEELTLEDLRADQSFVIFLQQCANLIRKIQAKLAMSLSRNPYPSQASKPRGDGQPGGPD